MFENPVSCLLVGFVAGVAVCYAIGIIRFDMGVSRQKKTFSVCQDDVFSREELQNLEFMRYLIEAGRVSDHIQ
jgi:hypothetical protein